MHGKITETIKLQKSIGNSQTTRHESNSKDFIRQFMTNITLAYRVDELKFKLFQAFTTQSL